MINVTKTYLPNKEKYKSYVDRIYASGWLTNNGQFVRELETKLAAYLGVERLLLVSNGTLALQIAYRALGLKGELITTPFSFVATTSSLIWEGLAPVFADIKPGSLNIDPAMIRKAITSQTTGIVPVHVFGNACEIEEIDEIAQTYKLKVIYDAAHAFNVKYRSKSILTHGDASTLSFHSTKVFHTIEGGAIVFRREEDYEKAKLMINFGIPGYDQISMLGINCKMNEFQAAMGLCMLDEMEGIFNARKKVWERYENAFNCIEKVTRQHQNPESDRNYSYYPLVFHNEAVALEVKQKLNSQNIFPRRYFYPSLENLPYLNDQKEMFHSSSIAPRILCLPMYDTLDELDQDRIIKTVIENC